MHSSTPATSAPSINTTSLTPPHYASAGAAERPPAPKQARKSPTGTADAAGASQPRSPAPLPGSAADEVRMWWGVGMRWGGPGGLCCWLAAAPGLASTSSVETSSLNHSTTPTSTIHQEAYLAQYQKRVGLLPLEIPDVTDSRGWEYVASRLRIRFVAVDPGVTDRSRLDQRAHY